MEYWEETSCPSFCSYPLNVNLMAKLTVWKTLVPILFMVISITSINSIVWLQWLLIFQIHCEVGEIFYFFMADAVFLKLGKKGKKKSLGL